MTAAPLGRRAAAYAIDVAIAVLVLLIGAGAGWALAAAIGSALFIIPSVAWLFGLAWALVYTALQGGRGSIGMRLRGIRLQRAGTGARLGFGRALLRNVVWGLATSILVGYFTPLFDSSGRFQGWHDKASDALMIDDRAPAPEPAPEPEAVREAPAPILQAPSFDRLPPAPVGGFAPSTEPDPAASPAPARPSAVAPVPAEGAMIASVPGITPRPAAPSASSPAPAAPLAEPAGASRTAAPAAAAVPPTARPAARPAAASDQLSETRVTRDPHAIVLIWDDGTRHTVGRRTLFGRNPSPEEGAATVAVRDETLSLSKTHVEVDVGADGAWIIDRHSTNGVTIVRAGRRIPCVPGRREPLHAGDALEIGDRVVTLGGLS
ncbi:MAG TPA: RDD family protein [Microbacterium sp.]|nr:RDD family protein [Microbacterium sp.]